MKFLVKLHLSYKYYYNYFKGVTLCLNLNVNNKCDNEVAYVRNILPEAVGILLFVRNEIQN